MENNLEFSRIHHHMNTPCKGCLKHRLEFMQKEEEQLIFLLKTSASIREGWKFLAKP